MRITSPANVATVRMLRVAAPLTCAATVIVGSLALANGSDVLAAINFFCAGVTAVLTWVEWRIFEV